MVAPAKRGELTHSEEMFAQAVASGETAEAAFGRIYGYNFASHGHTNSSRVMRKPCVQERIIELMSGVAERHEATRDFVIGELMKMAGLDVAKYMRWDNESLEIVPSGDLTPEQTRAISKVTMTPEGRPKLEFHDKMHALKLLCDILGLTGDAVGNTVNTFVIQAPAVVKDEKAFENQMQSFLDLEALPKPLEG